MNFFPVYIYFIALSFIVSLTVYSSSNRIHSYLKIFPPFLLATFIAEAIGSYLWYRGETNLFIYNFFTTLEFCFYLWFLGTVISNKKVKKTLIVSIFFYFIIAIINIFFIQKMKSFHSITYALGCLLIVSFCIYYFLELFRLPRSINLKANPVFWICSGLLFFYCCGFPLYTLINFYKSIPKIILDSFDGIVTILNVFLYSLFTIAFLCRIKTRKYTLLPL